MVGDAAIMQNPSVFTCRKEERERLFFLFFGISLGFRKHYYPTSWIEASMHHFWKANHTAKTRQMKAAIWFQASFVPKAAIEKRMKIVSVITS